MCYVYTVPRLRRRQARERACRPLGESGPDVGVTHGHTDCHSPARKTREVGLRTDDRWDASRRRNEVRQREREILNSCFEEKDVSLG